MDIEMREILEGLLERVDNLSRKDETTVSGAIPTVVQPYTLRRRAYPSAISGMFGRLEKAVLSLSRKMKGRPVKKKRRRGGNKILRGIM
jgi:hypothetical protein